MSKKKRLNNAAELPVKTEKLSAKRLKEAGIDQKDFDLSTQLPEPKGYKILIALPKPAKKTDGGIVKAAETLFAEEIMSICGKVVEMGADAYTGDRFPSGPYCKVGDWIMMRAYSGTRFKVNGLEMRLINDDSVEATVEDPRGILKV